MNAMEQVQRAQMMAKASAFETLSAFAFIAVARRSGLTDVEIGGLTGAAWEGQASAELVASLAVCGALVDLTQVRLEVRRLTTN